MNEDSKAVCLAVLAKAPVPGLAKTRLIPALGAVGAARLQRRFTQRTLRTALRSGLGPVALWCAPQVQHRFFQALRRSGVPWPCTRSLKAT
ncbi:TIGR04282 family arsenosugar biosynthesis glycosyltransferase [Ideonella paludis]|uniref:TIGR04282 family arsenosugar biosynthesis glycosyltransferase n=1 Tax=Ideonella paludis TaxID=1233411 RepID=UPI0036400E5C